MEAATEADAKMKKSCENACTKAEKAEKLKQEAIDRVNQVAKEW